MQVVKHSVEARTQAQAQWIGRAEGTGSGRLAQRDGPTVVWGIESLSVQTSKRNNMASSTSFVRHLKPVIISRVTSSVAPLLPLPLISNISSLPLPIALNDIDGTSAYLWQHRPDHLVAFFGELEQASRFHLRL